MSPAPLVTILTRAEDMTVRRASLVLGILGPPLLGFSWGIYLSNVQSPYKMHIGFLQACTLQVFPQSLSLAFSLFGTYFCFQFQGKISEPTLFGSYSFLKL